MKARLTKLATALVLLAACGGDSGYSPTAPRTPLPPPTPAPVGGLLQGHFYFSVGSSNRPEEVQVLVDGVLVYTGPLVEPSPWDYHPYPTWLSGYFTAPAVGHHTLSLRVTRQPVSPERYALYSELQLHRTETDGTILSNRSVASWHEAVTLATGDAWTGTFQIVE